MTNEEIDRKVEEWHNSTSNLVIWQFIGISREEYSAYVELREPKQ